MTSRFDEAAASAYQLGGLDALYEYVITSGASSVSCPVPDGKGGHPRLCTVCCSPAGVLGGGVARQNLALEHMMRGVQAAFEVIEKSNFTMPQMPDIDMEALKKQLEAIDGILKPR